MTLSELRESLKEDQIIELMESLGSTYYPDKSSSKELIFSTICHGGSSPKLYYYVDSQMFYCFTDCNKPMSIFDIIMSAKDFSQDEFFRAKQYIEMVLNLDSYSVGFGKQELISDWKILNRYKRRNQKKEALGNKKDTLKFYDSSALDRFADIYYQG